MEPARLYSDEAEGAAIVAVLWDQARFDEVADIVQATDFHSSAHRALWSAIVSMRGEGRNLDEIEVWQEAKTRHGLHGSFGAEELARLCEREGWKAAAVKQHAQTVRDFAVLRAVQRSATDVLATLGTVHPSQAAEVLDQLDAAVFAARSRQVANAGPIVLREVIRETFGTLEQAFRGEASNLIPTGFRALDEVMVGLVRRKMTVIGGRPSMGKSSLLQGMLVNIARRGKACCLFTIEDDRQMWTMRAMSGESGTPVSNIQHGRLSDADSSMVFTAADDLSRMPVYLDDATNTSPDLIRAKVRQLKRQVDVQVVAVDYLTLMQPPAGRRYGSQEERIGATSQALAALAKELDVALVLAVQLNRECEKRPDKKPIKSDIRDSGSVEQDAYQILFVHRDSVYDPEKRADDADIIVAKHKNGATGSVKMRWHGPSCSFHDLPKASGW